jgi:hypothetical protein
MGDKRVEQTDVAAQAVSGKILQCSLAVGLGRPVQCVRLAEPLDALLFRLILATLQLFHYDQSGQTQGRGTEGLQPSDGGWAPAQNVDRYVGIHQDHGSRLRVCACSRRRRANS